MRTKLFVLAALLTIAPALFSVSPAQAQNEILFGQNQYYSVLFRGNGEAIVTARFEITNPNDNPLTDYSFSIPDVQANEVSIYQQNTPVTCLDFDYSQPTHPCLKYGTTPIDNTSSYYPYRAPTNTTYKRVTFTQVGTLYKFTFPQPVESQQTTTVVLSYTAFGYAKELLGRFTYNFTTAKVPARIANVQVAVDVDSELYIDGQRSQVQYAQQANDTTIPSSFGLGTNADISNPLFSSYVNSIGETGPVVKNAKDLAPDESFTVTGAYARSWWRLYLARIVTIIIIIVLIILGLWWINRWWHGHHQVSTPVNQPPAAPHDSSTLPFQFSPALWAFLSLVATGLWLWGSTYLGTLLDTPTVGGAERSIIQIFLFLIVAGITILFLIGPGLWVATARGPKGFLTVVIFQIFWLFVFMIIAIILVRTFGSVQPTPSYIDPAF